MEIKSKLRTKFKHEPVHIAHPWMFDTKDTVILYQKGGLSYVKPGKDGVGYRFRVEKLSPVFTVKVPHSVVQARKYPAFDAAKQQLVRKIVRYENKIFKKLDREGYRGYWVTTDKMDDPQVIVSSKDNHFEIAAWYFLGAFVVKA